MCVNMLILAHGSRTRRKITIEMSEVTGYDGNKLWGKGRKSMGIGKARGLHRGFYDENSSV